MRRWTILLVLSLAACRPSLPGVLPDGWEARPTLGDGAIRLETDVGEAAGRTVLALLEQTHREFSGQFGNEGFADAPLKVLLFREPADYGRYTGDRFAAGVEDEGAIVHGLGQFHSRRRFGQVVAREIAVVATPELSMTMRHEMSHAFIDLLHYRMPYALDEGIAVYLTPPSGRPGGPARLPRPGDELYSVARLLALEREEFLASPRRNYSQSYALVAYLIHIDGKASLADLRGLADRAGDLAAEADAGEISAAVRRMFAPR